MITLSGLEKSFSRQKVLHDISLTIPEGSVTALIGPSGSGKSTLLRCINLLEIAQAGKLTIGHEEIIFLRRGAKKKRRSAYLPANRHGLSELPVISASVGAGKYYAGAGGGAEMAP